RVRANSESFYKSKLLKRQRFRLMQQPERNRQELLHSTVHMDAAHAKPFTTVLAACLAGPALAATDGWFDSATVARTDSKIIRANLDYFSRQFVSQHSRIGVGWVPSGECVEIASANPDLVDAHHCLSR